MRRKILIAVIAIIVGCAAYLFFTRKNPVVYRYVDRAAGNYSAFVILNPFREREPERKAEAVLKGLKDRNCTQALSLPALDSARIDYLCEREGKYPLETWSLMDRKGNDGNAELIYTINRTAHDGKASASLVWITVENRGAWRATKYDAYY